MARGSSGAKAPPLAARPKYDNGLVDWRVDQADGEQKILRVWQTDQHANVKCSLKFAAWDAVDSALFGRYPLFKLHIVTWSTNHSHCTCRCHLKTSSSTPTLSSKRQQRGYLFEVGCVALFYWPEGEEDYKRGLVLPWDLLQNSPLLLCR